MVSEKIKGKFQRREKTPEEIHLEECQKQASLVKKMENKISSLKEKIVKADKDKVSAKASYENKLKQLETDKVNYGKEIDSVTNQVSKEKDKYNSMNCPKI